MAIKIVPYESVHQAAVSQLNSRLRAHNAGVQLAGNPLSEWLPKGAGRQLYQERFLALDEDSSVRGGYVLKHQEFRMRGSTCTVCQYQGPLSEGVIDRQFNHVGLLLLSNVMRQNSRLFALGMGGVHNPFPQLLQARRWTIVPVPFFFRVVRARSFFRNIVMLRKSQLRRIGCDILANTGLGGIAIKTINLWNRRGIRREAIRCCEVERFAAWTDRLWHRFRDRFAFAAVRDSLALNVLYPESDGRFLRLRVRRAERDLGWAVVMLTPMKDSNHFGNMKVGTLVDGFCDPAETATVVDCARRELETRGADLIVSNQTHQTWCDGLRAAGFLTGPTNFHFAASPQLAKEFAPLANSLSTFHINRGDGDGPVHL